MEEDSFNIASDAAVDSNLQKVEAVLKDLRLSSAVPGDASISKSFGSDLFSQKVEALEPDDSFSWRPQNPANDHFEEPQGTPVSFEDPLSEVMQETEELRSQEIMLQEEVTARAFEIHCLKEELDLLQEATTKASDEQHSTEYYLEQLNEQLAARQRDLMQLQLQWDSVRQPLEEKKRSLEESLYKDKPTALEKLYKLREIELEKISILSEIQKREVEKSKLEADFKGRPEVASRGSYIARIKEITKNTRKLDADIERILKDTRELQLESNSIQERLHRSFAIADEMMSREAKKDSVGQQVSTLLSSLHETFEQICQQILMTDRVRREAAEHEKKLATIAFRSLDADKIQADLDAMKIENEKIQKTRL